MAELLRLFGCYDAGAGLAPSAERRFALSASASPKRRGHKRPRPLPRHLRIPSLASLAPGKPEKPPTNAIWYIVLYISTGLSVLFLRNIRVQISLSAPVFFSSKIFQLRRSRYQKVLKGRQKNFLKVFLRLKLIWNYTRFDALLTAGLLRLFGCYDVGSVPVSA